MAKNKSRAFETKLVGSIASVLVAALIGLFVWLAGVASRLSVIEQGNEIRSDAAHRVEDANKEALTRIEHEREANDARVRDDLRELRSRVYPAVTH